MRWCRLLFGSLATRLLWQTLLLSVLPMLVIAVFALYASAALIRARLAEEAQYVGGQVTSDVLERATTTSHAAELLAESPTIRTLTETGDEDQLSAFMLSVKPQLGVDVMDVTDPSGSVVAAAQDSAVGENLPDSLLRRVNPDAAGRWALFDDPHGLMLRATYPIQGPAGHTVGMMEVGVLFGPSYLHSRQTGSRAELALSWNNHVRASTFALSSAQLPTGQEVEAQPSHRLSRTVNIGGTHYFSTFRMIESHADEPVTLAVLTPLAPVASVTRVLWLLLSALVLCLCIAIVALTWGMARAITAPFRQLISAILRVQDGDLRAHVQPTAQNETRVLEVAFNTMLDSLGEQERERTGHEAELVHLAFHDPLTGLPNRSLLEQALDAAVAEAGRGRPSTLMYIDFDQFKLVNDTLGHDSGDRLLVTLAHQVRSALRDEDTLARLGGDEFAVLLTGLHLEHGMQVAERVRSVVNEYRFIESGQGFALGVSVGVTAITASDSASEVLRRADIACYTAKVEGRNKVAVYEPDTATLALLSGDGVWTVELKDALQDSRLRLVFQPIMRLNGHAIDHYETLVRLVKRDGRLVEPAAFIPTAERTGLIRDLDHWVLNAALDRMQQEQARGNPIRLAINLSGITLGSSESAEFIHHAIGAKGIDPRALTFEITETAVRTNLTKHRTAIEVLREIGCSFALDGFGTGSSSFTYLAELPVDSVKIDGSFVRDVARNSFNQAIVRAIANITRSMGKESVAEWVEDAETLATLRRLHVDLAQGHFIGYPSGQLTTLLGPVPAGQQPERTPGERAVVR